MAQLILLQYCGAGPRGGGDVPSSRACDWDVPAGQQRSEFDFLLLCRDGNCSWGLLLLVRLLFSWDYWVKSGVRSLAVTCKKRGSFAWLLDKVKYRALWLLSGGGSLQQPEGRAWHLNDSPGVPLLFSRGELCVVCAVFCLA